MKKVMSIVITCALLLSACGSASVTATMQETESAAEEARLESTPAKEEETGRDNTGKENKEKEGLSSDDEQLMLKSADAVPEGEWQVEASFPDRRGKVDDTLAMNSIVGFDYYSGQGKMYVSLSDEVLSFDMYVNDKKVDTSDISAGTVYELDFPGTSKNGRNTVTVCAIEPLDIKDAVKINIPYPEIREGTPEDAGIRQEALDAISDIISSDIESGFSSAQLAVVRNGVLVYENAWGKTNSYNPDGSRKTDSADVTVDTLYDLASVTKMVTVNYCLQKLATEGEISLDAKITDYLGGRFVNETMDFGYDKTKIAEAEENPGIDVQKKWKASLTIRDLLRHQGGFPAGPKYYDQWVNAPTQEIGSEYDNILYAGNDGTKETKENTVEAICKTPLMYEPGTKTLYSDVDYMLLGIIIEQVTGKDLDSYTKESFYKPMGLSHITFKPLENGFSPEDCAATELNGNTRDGGRSFPGARTETIQGEVHDEMAYHSMGGISGHAGLFSNAGDLARLASVMLTGGYGNNRFFSRNIIDTFTAPKKEDAANWGLGWWREGDDQRPWYFGAESSSDVIGHQGWTGTLVMIDPENDLVVAYLTNKINTSVTDKEVNPNKFNGGFYTASTLGFVPQLLTIGMDGKEPVHDQIFSLLAEMTKDSMKLVDPEQADPDHPSCKNVESKISVLVKWAEESGDDDNIRLANDIAARWDKYQVVYNPGSAVESIMAGMSMDDKISQMIIPAIRTWNEENVTDLTAVPELKEVLKKHQYAGVILFGANITGNEQLTRLIDDLQKNNLETDKTNVHIPYLTPVDEEGGIVLRITSGTRMTGNMAVGATQNAESNAETTGTILGEELAAVGFNADFAPVVDVNNNPSNPVIGTRSFSDDPEYVSKLAGSFAKGLAKSNIIATYKHFPGHGDTGVDSHIGTPSVEKTYEELLKTELVPFKSVIENGADMIMTAHITYPLIDEEVVFGDGVTKGYYPATMSKKMITDILRNDLKFEGVVVTDALEMDAIRTAGLVEGAEDSTEYRVNIAEKVINAGVDMLLLPVDLNNAAAASFYDDYIAGIAAKVESGEISKERIDESVKRILSLKVKYGILNTDSEGAAETDIEEKVKKCLEIVGSPEHHDSEMEIAKEAITMLKNDSNTLPLSDAEKIVFLGRQEVDLTTIRPAVEEAVNKGLISKNAEISFDYYYDGSGETKLHYTDEIKEKISSADAVVGFSYASGNALLDEENPQYIAMQDAIRDIHKAGGKFILISENLPYDAAIYTDADAIILAYCGAGMGVDPTERTESGKGMKARNANIVAAIEAVFGAVSPKGHLPVNIPVVKESTDGTLSYGTENLYDRGFGLEY